MNKILDMKKFLSVLSLLALLGFGATQLSYAEDIATTEAATATVESVAVEGAVDAVESNADTAEAVATEATPAEATAAPAPVPNKGDTAWMIVATALVSLMVIPGLALF